MPTKNVTVEIVGQSVTQHNNNLYRLWPGMKVRVDEETADRWIDIGLAKPSASKGAVAMADSRAMAEASRRGMAPPEPVREAVRPDLRIGVRQHTASGGTESEPLNLTDERPRRERTPDAAPDEDAEEAEGEDEEETEEAPDEDDAPAEAPAEAPPAPQATGASARANLTRPQVARRRSR